jgi:uncharacterized protein YjbI with pentapeptide repeats
VFLGQGGGYGLMMSDDADAPKRPKTKAEDNPWYLLATLYGVPKLGYDRLQIKNRIAWNRYFAANLDEETRTKLIEEKRHTAEELAPFSLDELQEVATAFAERCKVSPKEFALPVNGAEIDFSNVEFEQEALFDKYLFGGACSFRGATFSRYTSFEGAAFFVVADFDGALFSSVVTYSYAAFSGPANFKLATFSRSVDFRFVVFSDYVSFDSVAFSFMAIFTSTSFSDRVNFTGAAFSALSTFVNVEMKDETLLQKVTFETAPPIFFGAKLHQGTVWRGITWPLKPKDKKEAEEFVDAYACLKLEMDRLKKHEDELDFFALELQSRRVLLGPWRGWLIWLYGFFSDYGRSYFWPFYWLVATIAAGAWVFRGFDALGPLRSYGLSAANTLNVFGFRKDFFGNEFMKDLSSWLDVVAAAQTVLGAILLFLFGLGIRNKFRMK